MLAGEVGSLRRLLVVSAAALIAAVAFAWIAAGSMSAYASDGGTAKASAQNFEESLRMRITKKDGKHVAAKGSASGTIDGKISLKLHMVNGSKATATFHGHNSHGAITGTGVAKYHVSGAVSYYTGKITSLEGDGKYAHAASRGISFSGTVNRRTYRVKMSLAGRWHA